MDVEQRGHPSTEHIAEVVGDLPHRSQIHRLVRRRSRPVTRLACHDPATRASERRRRRSTPFARASRSESRRIRFERARRRHPRLPARAAPPRRGRAARGSKRSGDRRPGRGCRSSAPGRSARNDSASSPERLVGVRRHVDGPFETHLVQRVVVVGNSSGNRGRGAGAPMRAEPATARSPRGAGSTRGGAALP